MWGKWKKIEKRRSFFDCLKTKLGYTSFDDWYKLSIGDICKHGGRGLLHYYNNSPSQALIDVYPDHNWLMWKFNILPKGYWDDFENRRAYFDWLGKKLGFNNMLDWYNVTTEDIYLYNGKSLLVNCYGGSLPQALQHLYPDHNWLMWKFNIVPKGYWETVNNQRAQVIE